MSIAMAMAKTQMNKMSPYSGIFLGDSTARNICASTDEKSIGKGSRHRPDRVLLAPKNSFALSFKRAPPLFLQNLKMTCHSVCRRCFLQNNRSLCLPPPLHSRTLLIWPKTINQGVSDRRRSHCCSEGQRHSKGTYLFGL
jgi:hypothetical protein